MIRTHVIPRGAALAALFLMLLAASAASLWTPDTAGAVTPSIAAGDEDSLAVAANGSLWSWGGNRYGSGVGDLFPRTIPTAMGDPTTWQTVSRGGHFGAAINYDGQLYTWGDNNFGQLGLGDWTDRLLPTRVNVPAGGAYWLSVSCGQEHTLAIRNDHTLWAWGADSYGQLGLDQAGSKHTPTRVGTDSDWTTVACGAYHCAAIKQDGTLWTWGNNASGQLGLGNTDDWYATPWHVPGSTSWASVSCSTDVSNGFTLALRSNGALYACGYNGDGQLGLGDQAERHQFVRVQAGTLWSRASAGKYHALGVKTDGTLWGWGMNVNGQIGTAAQTRTTPFQIGTDADWAGVSAGGTHSLGFKTDNSVWAWGANWFGQLGIGYPELRCNPAQVGTEDGWLQIDASRDHTAAVRADGTLWAWGEAGLGQLGLGEDTPSRTDAPLRVGSANDWASVACGHYFTLAIKQDGTLWAWGVNDNGQLGLGDTELRWSPTRVGTRTDWASVACGDEYDTGYVLAVTTGGELWAWGANGAGQLGLGSTGGTHRQPARVGSAGNWAMAACGSNHSAAITTDGQLYTWGANGAGQLGFDDTVARTSPTHLTLAFDGWVDVACGSDFAGSSATGEGGFTLAVRNSAGERTLWAWGSNHLAQLGLGDYLDRDVPTRVGSATDWATVEASCTEGVSLALKTGGTAWSAGDGLWGTLGIGRYGPSPTFAQIGSQTDWTALACGGGNAYGLRGAGALWAWGDNMDGQLGLGDPARYPYPVMLVLSGAADNEPPSVAPAPRAALRADGWSKTPVTVRFNAADAGSGVSRVQYSTTGGVSWTAGARVVSASARITRNGITLVRYQAIDRRANASGIGEVTVKVDQVRPRPRTLAAASVRRGNIARLRYRVADIAPVTCRMVFVIKNSAGRVVLKLATAAAKPNVDLYRGFRCKLARGTYRWYLYATDQAGNTQLRVASNSLTVR